jgi:site-specific DNA recombinase
MTAEHLRAGLYGRVSLQRKRKKGARATAEDRSCRQQDEANSAACERYGWSVAARYADPGRSASRFARAAREDYERLLADITARRLDVVVFWESSRGGRELVAWATLLHECRRCGVKIYITDHDHLYDLDIARDWRTLAEDGVDSAYESEKTARRIRRDVDDNAAAGRPHGLILFGYERLYDEHTRELAEQRAHPAHAATVKEVITRVAAGHPANSIATDMTRRKVPTPRGGPWNAAGVRRIATNQAYLGRRGHNGTWVPAIWPALIDEPTFWRAQRILNDPSRPAFRPGAARHLLSYLATCRPCGSVLSVSLVRGTPMYLCKERHCVGIREDWLDLFVTGAVSAMLDSPAFWEEAGRSSDADVLAERAKADELRADLREHVHLAKQRKISPASFAEIEASLLEQIGAAEKRVTSIAAPPVLRELSRSPAGARKMFEGSPLAVRKQALRELFGEISVRRATRHGKHGFDPERVRLVPRGSERK